jgi:DNA-directed RNA polymerase specialized sigma24 family protein
MSKDAQCLSRGDVQLQVVKIGDRGPALHLPPKPPASAAFSTANPEPRQPAAASLRGAWPQDPPNPPDSWAEFEFLKRQFEAGAISKAELERYHQLKAPRFAYLSRRVLEGKQSDAQWEEWGLMIMEGAVYYERVYSVAEGSTVSDVFLKASAFLQQIVNADQPWAFFKTMARRRVLDYCLATERRQKRVVSADQPAAQDSDDSLLDFLPAAVERTDAGWLAAMTEDMARVRQLLADYPNQAHAQFFEWYLEGWQIRDIAHAFTVDKDMVVTENKVQLALDRLSRMIMKDYIARNPGVLRDYPNSEHVAWHRRWLERDSAIRIAREAGCAKEAVREGILLVNKYLLKYGKPPDSQDHR